MTLNTQQAWQWIHKYDNEYTTSSTINTQVWQWIHNKHDNEYTTCMTMSTHPVWQLQITNLIYLYILWQWVHNHHGNEDTSDMKISTLPAWVWVHIQQNKELTTSMTLALWLLVQHNNICTSNMTIGQHHEIYTSIMTMSTHPSMAINIHQLLSLFVYKSLCCILYLPVPWNAYTAMTFDQH